MNPMSEDQQTSTYILRLLHGTAGDVSGVIERVRTGAKHKFEGREALCELLRTLLANENRGQQT